MAQKSILIAGATGYIGRAVVNMALNQGYKVFAMTRSTSDALPQHPSLITLATEFDERSGWTTDLPPTDVIISCLASRTGTARDANLVDYQMNSALLHHAAQHGKPHFILLSAICVQKPKLAFQFEKLRFEDELRSSGLRYSIVRPTAFFKSLSGQIQRVQQEKAFLMFATGSLTACTPISDRDLAEYILQCIDTPERHDKILPIGGPHPAITPREQAKMMFKVFGKPPKMRSVSPKLFTMLRLLLAPLAVFSKWAQEKQELMRIAHYYATESMLTWDATRHCYDAGATPSTGTDTLLSHFIAIRDGGRYQRTDASSRLY